uniref:FAD-dependent oxidoreductase domain-containing protein 2 n=1 Tax=Capitella teleta TaxID=283909 RepID=X1ZGH7_CAPTE
MLILIVLLGSWEFTLSEEIHHDYIIVGSGPSGLQMGHFLQKAQRDYVILERSNVSGSFYNTYPRHNRLISINKRNTGKVNSEFNMRHDWNSLLSDNTDLLFKEFSKEFFPKREDAVRYFNAYEEVLKLNVLHGVEVEGIRREWNAQQNGQVYIMSDQRGEQYSCRYLFIATGLWKPTIPEAISGLHLVEGYESASVNPADYEGKSVLVLGHGNAAFETADAIYPQANVVHVIGRSRVRLSWETHYVGDVRAVNNGLLDTYQLKSMDGVAEGPLSDLEFFRDKNEPDRLRLRMNGTAKDNFALRHSYDAVIRCLGFHFDDSIFHSDFKPKRLPGPLGKYPYIRGTHEVAGMPDMFVIGTASHFLDFRKSSGGFIHGFRYTGRMVHRLLEWKNHNVPWPSLTLSLEDLLSHVMKRINEASGIYQMFTVLADVISIRDDGETFQYFEEYPTSLLPDFTNHTGTPLNRHFVVLLQYGSSYSGPGKDVFRKGRATGQADQAHRSNFLHPVIYYYDHPLSGTEMSSRPEGWHLPRPQRIHHIVEDFLTTWLSTQAHFLPLRRFFEQCLQTDLRSFDRLDCLYFSFTRNQLPVTCFRLDLAGKGVDNPGSFGVVRNAKI